MKLASRIARSSCCAHQVVPEKDPSTRNSGLLNAEGEGNSRYGLSESRNISLLTAVSRLSPRFPRFQTVKRRDLPRFVTIAIDTSLPEKSEVMITIQGATEKANPFIEPPTIEVTNSADKDLVGNRFFAKKD